MRLAGAFHSSSSVSLPTAHPKTSSDETDKIPAVPSYKRETTEMKQDNFLKSIDCPVAARLEILNFWESSGPCRKGLRALSRELMGKDMAVRGLQ